MTTPRPSPASDSYSQNRLHRIKNQHETIEFNGRLIGKASTEDDYNPRWTELFIYRTESGNYVVARVGRSVVYHLPDSACNTGSATPGRELPIDAEPCERCSPPALDAEDFDAEVFYDMELDRWAATVCRAEEVVSKLVWQASPQDPPYMSHVAQRALHEATERDPYLAERVVTIKRIK